MFWKKVILAASCLLLAGLLSVPALAAEDEAVPISTVEELALLGRDPAGSYVLTRDLDMSGVDWVPVAFQGTFDGGGHTIFNLSVSEAGEARAETVDGNNKRYDTVFAGFFSTLIGAKVSGLTLQGVDIALECREHCFLGGIAGYIKDSEITNCAVLDARITMVNACVPDSAGSDRYNVGLGGIAGFGSGLISGCQVDVVLVFDDQSDRSLKSEEFLGGVLSCGNANIQDCSVKIQGYDACRGYVHNGGLVGMSYRYDKSESIQPISGCHVEGQISFFEDNPDRRAYCKAYVGERLSATPIKNCTESFQRNETTDYSARLSPEKCDEPLVEDEVRQAFCNEPGCTVHTCTVCGNSWRDSFVVVPHQPGEWTVTQPATYEDSGMKVLRCAVCGETLEEAVINPHVAGEWVVSREPGYGAEGLRQLLCADCGEALEEEVIPALVPVSAVTLDRSSLELTCGESASLRWGVTPAGAADSSVVWSSSDERVARVDADGTVTAVGGGSAVVTCASADGFASAACSVTVKLTVFQWIRRYLLFGWLRG